MIKKLEDIIDKYSHLDYIDIESIILSYWLVIDYIDFWKINWIRYQNRIWINSNMSKEKQRYTLAHEFCHFLMWEKWVSSWTFWTKDKRENRADEFAMRLLLPERIVKELYNKYKDIKIVASKLWVPDEIARDRIVTLVF